MAKKRKLNSRGAYSIVSDDDRKKINGKIRKMMENPAFPMKTGLFLTEDHESMPVFAPIAPIEKVWARKQQSNGASGARIVLTKDNYGHRGTGLGGVGGTSCEAIDIVVGSLSCEKKLFDGETKSRANFITDGARIYLTERGDIQHYFALGEASQAVSVSSTLKSGIGIKADHTLIIGRERVRILAGLSMAKGGERLVNMNQAVTPRIEIAATGDKNAQPAVLGDNLVDYLKKQSERIVTAMERIQKIENKLTNMQVSFAAHFHSGAGIGYIQTFPDPALITAATKSVPVLLNTTRENIIEIWNQHLEDIDAMGTSEDFLRGSKDIRSSTVYIGN